MRGEGSHEVISSRGVGPEPLPDDDELAARVCAALHAEAGLLTCRVLSVHDDRCGALDEIPPEGWDGCIEVRVEAGAIYLGGQVPSVGHRRLAGLVTWWVPGCRDVINALEITGPSSEEDEALAEDVRWLLERDPSLDARGVVVRARRRTVRLEGIVPTDADALAAERNAWCVFGVDAVENRLEVRTRCLSDD